MSFGVLLGAYKMVPNALFEFVKGYMFKLKWGVKLLLKTTEIVPHFHAVWLNYQGITPQLNVRAAVNSFRVHTVWRVSVVSTTLENKRCEKNPNLSYEAGTSFFVCVSECGWV